MPHPLAATSPPRRSSSAKGSASKDAGRIPIWDRPLKKGQKSSSPSKLGGGDDSSPDRADGDSVARKPPRPNMPKRPVWETIEPDEDERRESAMLVRTAQRHNRLDLAQKQLGEAPLAPKFAPRASTSAPMSAERHEKAQRMSRPRAVTPKFVRDTSPPPRRTSPQRAPIKPLTPRQELLAMPRYYPAPDGDEQAMLAQANAALQTTGSFGAGSGAGAGFGADGQYGSGDYNQQFDAYGAPLTPDRARSSSPPRSPPRSPSPGSASARRPLSPERQRVVDAMAVPHRRHQTSKFVSPNRGAVFMPTSAVPPELRPFKGNECL